MRVIKFKLLTQDSTHQGLELAVSECSHDNHTVRKITLKGYYKLLSSESNNNSLIIKNIQNSEIEFKPDTNELAINSSRFIIFPTKTDFLFAVSKIIENNDNWEIELAFPHAWNGEKITKIQLSNTNKQFKEIIEEDKDECFFTINGIKNHDFLLSTSGTKVFVIPPNSFQNLEKSVLFHPEPLEIFVRSPKKNNNYYLIKCQSDLTRIGLKDYKKIRIISPEKINNGDTIKFNLANLKDILQRDKEDGILRIDNDHRSFTKIQGSSVISPQQQAQRDIQKQIKKFLKKYQNEQAERINNRQKNLENYFLLLQRIHDKINDSVSKELIDQKNRLSRELAEFAEPAQLENKIILLENQIFLSAASYQNQEKITQFKQELAKIDQQFMKLTEEIGKYQNSLSEYLKEKSTLIYENDSQLQQILAKYNIGQQVLFDDLAWSEGSFWLQEDGSIDYQSLDNYLQEKSSSKEGLPNKLGYLPKDLKDKEWKMWNGAQIKKSEANKAKKLGYLLEQWKDPQYQKYKEKKRILADGIIGVLQRKWNPPLSDEHKRLIEDSKEEDELAANILKVQEERLLTQDKDYFKNFISQELKKSPVVNIDELGIYSTYAQEIDEIKRRKNFENYLEKAISKIYQARGDKVSSLSEAQDQAKKNINKTFQRTKIKVQELHQQHQNWQAKIEKLESISEIIEFEQNFVLLLEKINCFCQQQWFPNFGKRERNQIKRAKDKKDLQEKVDSWKAKKVNWLFTRQINKYLRLYQELQEEKKQDYYSQWYQLREVNDLLTRAKDINRVSLNDEQIELKRTLEKIIEPMEQLYHIRSFQREFNNATSPEERQRNLRKIQESLQKITKKRKLTEQETQIQKKTEQNFHLIQQGKDTQKFIQINEQQPEIELLALEEESQGENDFTTENDNNQDWISQKSLIIFVIAGFLLIFLYRWYRKKKEEDPFW